MNLRQKVKQAKKQLALLEQKPKPHTQYGMVVDFQERSELQKIIDCKRKPSRNFHWNEDREIDYTKLTYIAFRVDGHTLAKMISANGKPFKMDEISSFIISVQNNQFYQYAVNVSKMQKHQKNERINDERYERQVNTVNYY